MQSTLSVYVHLTACIFLICSQLFLQPCLLLSYWENFAYNQEPKIKILKYNNGERESQKKKQFKHSPSCTEQQQYNKIRLWNYKCKTNWFISSGNKEDLLALHLNEGYLNSLASRQQFKGVDCTAKCNGDLDLQRKRWLRDSDHLTSMSTTWLLVSVKKHSFTWVNTNIAHSGSGWEQKKGIRSKPAFEYITLSQSAALWTSGVFQREKIILGFFFLRFRNLAVSLRRCKINTT